MDILQLKARIDKWKNIHTEFKEWPINPSINSGHHNVSYAQSLVAFANTDGGQFVIGVAQDRRIVGVDDPDRVMQWVDNIAYNNCEPPITVVQETVRSEDDAVVVVVNVPKGDQRPYQTNQGDYFIRTTSGKRRASRQELLRLFQATETFFYDETLVMRAALGDIDSSLVEQFVKHAYGRGMDELAVDYETLLKNLNLLRHQNSAFYPTISCVLFFGRRVQDFLPHAHLTAARFPGSDPSQPPSDLTQINGTVLDQLEDTTRFLRVHLLEEHRIEGFEPENFPEIPEDALREVIVNALSHRDYTIAAPVRVFVFDDRVDVRTPGGLPNTVTLESMKLGASHVLRNPTVYTLFSRLGLVTGAGSGVYRAIRAIEAATGKVPDLFLEGNEFVFSIPRRL
jgi:ATP-dependent DNA helicase RecG